MHTIRAQSWKSYDPSGRELFNRNQYVADRCDCLELGEFINHSRSGLFISSSLSKWKSRCGYVPVSTGGRLQGVGPQKWTLALVPLSLSSHSCIVGGGSIPADAAGKFVPASASPTERLPFFVERHQQRRHIRPLNFSHQPFSSGCPKAVKMMHPSRKAYVEDHMDEVRTHTIPELLDPAHRFCAQHTQPHSPRLD